LAVYFEGCDEEDVGGSGLALHETIVADDGGIATAPGDGVPV